MITLIPVGGLANRMRAIASAIALSNVTQQFLRIIWLRDKGLNCRYDELFCPLSFPNVTLKEGNTWDKVFLNYPKKSNFRLPLLWQAMWFDGRIYQKESICDALDYQTWVGTHRKNYIASFSPFFETTPELWTNLFQPTESLKKQIDSCCSFFTPHTVGVHIRRSDNTNSTNESPINIFMEKMDKELSEDSEVTFFICSDSDSAKKELKSHFGERLIVSKEKGERNNKTGMRGAVVDLFSLSRCHKIIGSYYSSFSEIAAQVGNKPLTIARKNKS